MAFDPDDVPRVTLADSRLKNSTLAISSKGALYKKKKKSLFIRMQYLYIWKPSKSPLACTTWNGLRKQI